MQKNYDHNHLEDPIYTSWEASGAFRADAESEKKPFTIPLPPPNVTGQLHLGHAAMLAIEDILIRYKKMTGHESLWVPGTDHAAIATESVVIKHLGLKSREELSREDFLVECRKFASEKHDTIVNQMKKMGAHLDWSREAYTFDEARNHAVNTIFKQLYDDGLIVRGHRMINWSVGAQSVLADDELEWEDRAEPFYYIRCGKFLMGTVRPETKCADSPLIVHPAGKYVVLKHNKTGDELILSEHAWKKDPTFAHLHADYELAEIVKGQEFVGQKFESETYAGVRKFSVITDEVIDMEKGTGAMTISAAHSADDYDLATRLGLKDMFFAKIDFNGRMTDIAGPCAELTVEEARKKSAEIMREKNLIIAEQKDYVHRVPLCYRSGCVVEPMISEQWFVAVEKEFTDSHTGKKTTLKRLTQDAVREGHVQIIPKRFEKVYFQWIDNLRDWCISRQIWWGHRIPVWYDDQKNIHLPEKQKLLFIRHGESEAGAKGLVAGRSQCPLSPKGREQAKATAQKLKGRKISKILSSDLPRCKETAEIIAAELGLKVDEYWPELQEMDYGSVTEKTLIKDKPAIERTLKNQDGESLTDLKLRVEKVWGKIRELKHSDGDILIVGHNTFTSILFADFHGLSPDQFSDHRKKWGEQDNAGIKELSILSAPHGENLHQDEDTLDTWFSSALWPFSTLGWPDTSAADYAKFYPTDVLETGHDILFFWVARMIMFGRYATGKYPYHTVYLHGLVTDEHGKKMSKSKGNGIDPLDVIAEYGADAVRLSLVVGTTPGNPIPLGKSKIGGYRNFVNKLWNAGRFVQMQAADVTPSSEPKSLTDHWILSRLSRVALRISEHLEKYEISPAGDAIYHFVWDEFCDWYIEASKVEPNPAFLKFVFSEILRLTHPLCPFVTQALWDELFDTDHHPLAESSFPQTDFHDDHAVQAFEMVQQIVTSIRRVRAEHKLNPKEKINVSISAGTHEKILTETQDLIRTLANLKELIIAKSCPTPEHSTTHLIGGLEIHIELPFDEGKRDKEIASLQQQITQLRERLNNKSYTEKAPAKLVKETLTQLAEAEEKLSRLTK